MQHYKDAGEEVSIELVTFGPGLHMLREDTSPVARAKAKGVKLGRGNKKDGKRSADEKRWGMTRTELEKRILRLYKGGTGKVKIGRTLGIGTGLVQQVLTEQARPFGVAEARASQ